MESAAADKQNTEASSKVPPKTVIKDIRDIQSDEDIYELVHDNIKQVLAKHGKYDFRGRPPKELEARPIHTFDWGDKYLGQWDSKKDTIRGQGVYVTAVVGELYEGYFKNSNFNGQGRHIDKKGIIRQGKFKDGKLNGEGIYIRESIGKKHGCIYEGMFKNGQFDGKGTCKWTDGRDYEGFWKQDERDGQGEMTWPDCRYYKGNWKMGK